MIDNTYGEAPEMPGVDACEKINAMIKVKKNDRYLNTDPLTTKLKVCTGHNLKLFNIFTESEEMVEKNTAFWLETALQVNPG